ncbi:hypothetical protein PJL18_04346 [Paenarthrobacter nicotinovorans]|nr:hypothetical protein [Paenarthrobacter nicotinovorans]
MLACEPGAVSNLATTVQEPSGRRQESHSSVDESMPWADSLWSTISPRVAGASPKAER